MIVVFWSRALLMDLHSENEPRLPVTRERQRNLCLSWLRQLKVNDLLKRLGASGTMGFYRHERNWVLANLYIWQLDLYEIAKLNLVTPEQLEEAREYCKTLDEKQLAATRESIEKAEKARTV